MPVKVLSRPFRTELVAAVLILLSTAANAASVTFTNVANSVNRGGVYSGYYALTINTQAILGLCDSRYSVVNPPVTWTADIRSYADIQGGAVGKFNNPSTPATLVKYSQAGWLYSQLGTLLPTDYAAQADVQEAIWKIMTPGYALVNVVGAGAWYTAGISGAHDAFDWSAVMRVVTANPATQGGKDVQEFLIGVVPVPAAAWLFGSALLGLGGLVRRKVSS